MRPANKAGFYKDRAEHQIKSLSQKLSKLTPVNGSNKGAAFISLHSAFKPAAEYEGMLGSIILEGFLGQAFAGAANDNPMSDAMMMADSPLAEFAMEFIGEADSHNNYGRGRGSIALYERFKTKSPAPAFNMAANDEMPHDFDERLDIEEHLAHLQNEYYAWKATEALIPA